MSIKFDGNLLLGYVAVSASALNLSDLHDVSITSPTNHQYLRYNSISTDWENALIDSDVSTYLGTAISGTEGVTFTSSGPNTYAIGLGAITPTSVAAIGAVTGSNLSGINTGNQTITLTGDATGSGTGSFAVTLATVNSDIGQFAVQTVNAKGLVTAATNLAVTGDVTGTSSGATLALTLATVNTTPQSDTFRKITVNGKGLVTGSSSVNTSDITTALGYTPVNRAGDTMSGNLDIGGFNVTNSAAPIAASVAPQVTAVLHNTNSGAAF